jgi:hypothetical protein
MFEGDLVTWNRNEEIKTFLNLNFINKKEKINGFSNKQKHDFGRRYERLYY